MRSVRCVTNFDEEDSTADHAHGEGLVRPCLEQLTETILRDL